MSHHVHPPRSETHISTKFILTGDDFTTGKVTCDITDHVAPDAHLNILGAKIPPRMPLAGW